MRVDIPVISKWARLVTMAGGEVVKRGDTITIAGGPSVSVRAVRESQRKRALEVQEIQGMPGLNLL